MCAVFLNVAWRGGVVLSVLFAHEKVMLLEKTHVVVID